MNFYAPLVVLQAVVPVMRERGGGSIVNVSSGTTLMLLVGTGGYAATKTALNMLSRTARAELAGENIVVSTVYPFVAATEFHQALRAGGGPGRRPGLEPQTPSARAATYELCGADTLTGRQVAAVLSSLSRTAAEPEQVEPAEVVARLTGASDYTIDGMPRLFGTTTAMASPATRTC